MKNRQLIDNSYSNDLLRILNPKDNEYVVALSTNVDTKDEAILTAAKSFHKVAGRSLTKSIEAFLADYLRKNGLYFIKSKGYWEGTINNNSYLIIAPKEKAVELVSHHADWFGQDSVIAFGPDCSVELFSRPEDYCTKVDNVWLRFAFDGDVIEQAQAENTVTEAVEPDEPEEPEMINLNGRNIAKRRSNEELASTEAPGNINPNPKWTEEAVAEVAYRVSPKVYNKYDWKLMRYTKDDFVQDAVIYILDLYDRRYFPLNEDSIDAIVYRMLDGFFVINKRKALTRQSSQEELSLNRSTTYDNSQNTKSAIDFVKDETGISQEDQEDAEVGKAIADEVISKLSAVPYATKKHSYKFTSGEFKGLELSPVIIAKLLMSNNYAQDILRQLGINVTNAGSDSKASYVMHKIQAVIQQLAELMNALDKEEREYVKTYMRTSMAK